MRFLQKPLSLLIVEDDPLIAEDLKGILLDHDYRVPAMASDERNAILCIKEQRPDVVLLDVRLGKQQSGINIARWINDFFPLPFLFITAFADGTTLEEAKQTHPWGYVLKPFTGPDVVVAVEVAYSNFHRHVMEDGKHMLTRINRQLTSPLSEREFEVLCALERGMSNKGLSDALCISENTVKTHLKHIFEKLNVVNRTQAMCILHDLKLKM